MNTKVRLVRCPRCRNVLPEPPGVPVYKCGGCDTVLLAKKRKNDSSDRVARSSSDQQSPDNSLSAPDRNRMDGDHDVAMKSETGTVDAPSTGIEEYSSCKLEIKQLSDGQEPGSSSNQEPLVNPIDEPDRNGDGNDLDLGHEDPGSVPEATTHNGMNEDQDAVKIQPSDGVEEYSSGKWKMKQLSDDQEACSSSNQRSRVNSINESDRNNDHNDPRSSTELSGHEDPESSPEGTTHNRMDQDEDEDQQVGLDHSSGKRKMEQLSDDQESGSRLNQELLVVSMNERDRNSDHYEPHCSAELSYHEDPESSPEAVVHNRSDVDHNQDDKIGAEFEESSSFSTLNEIEESSREAIANMKIARDSDGGSKSSFKSLIAEKLLDTRQKEVVYLDDDDTILEDGSADLCHRRRFDRVSSAETLENGRYGGMSYCGYEGSVSSFDGYDNQAPRKNRVGPKGDEHVGSGNGHHYKRRNGLWGKDEHWSVDARSVYGNTSPLRLGVNEFHENSRHRSHVIPENPKMERLELMKMVRELQDQLERTNVSNAVPQVPSYCNHGLNHPGRHTQRMAFSGEAMAVRRRDGDSCHHCCPQDRHFSAQLPRQCVCCNGPHYVPTTCYSSCCSGPLSPQHLSESEFLAPVRNDTRKQYRSPKKQYVRPIAGGSPWITCYRCSELLQLPQSFLVLKKRCHSVRCGGCSKVLNFTLSNGTHVSRYYPEEMIAAPPSSEVEEYANSRAGPVSCSDRSFQKSYSTETDRNGYRELGGERRKPIVSRDPSASSRTSSSKISGRRKSRSEIEPAAGGSPLHWLMGYASPSKVIRGGSEF